MITDAFRALGQVLPDACLLITTDGRIEAVNPAAERLLGRPRGALEGAPVDAIFCGAGSGLDEFIAFASRTRGPVVGALAVLGDPDVPCVCLGGLVEPARDGRPALLLLRLEKRAADTNRFRLLDRQIERLTEEIQRRREAERRAAEASRARDEAVAMISHDLRNPLNAVLAGATVLQEVDLPEERRTELIGAILRSGRRMQRLTGDLLDITRIEAGLFSVDPAPLDPRELVQEALRACEFGAGRTGVFLTSEVEDDLPPVRADRGRALQVFDNLLSNAIRHTPEGGRVTALAEKIEEGVRFGVADTGPGIPRDLLPRVFDRFHQGDGPRRGAAGLGLPIAKGIVEAHGGRIWAESGADGSRFFFVLPEAGADGRGAVA